MPSILLSLLQASGAHAAMVADIVPVLQRFYCRQISLVNTLKDTFLLEGPEEVEVGAFSRTAVCISGTILIIRDAAVALHTD